MIDIAKVKSWREEWQAGRPGFSQLRASQASTSAD